MVASWGDFLINWMFGYNYPVSDRTILAVNEYSLHTNWGKTCPKHGKVDDQKYECRLRKVKTLAYATTTNAMYGSKSHNL
jgi:hypothetical protein